jgi:hypothetical protein
VRRQGLRIQSRAALGVLALIVSWSFAGAAVTSSAQAATAAETAAVNWATGQIGSTAYYNLCLTFVQDAYQDGTGVNIQPLTNYGTFNSNTYPQQVWDGGFKSGTTGGSNTTPPYGALVFFNDPSNYEYSHVMISLGGGNNISSPDAYDESAVHYETLGEAAASGAYATYVGWWLPDGTSGGSSPVGNGSFVQVSGSSAVYELAGGAPLYVSSWTAVGGSQPVTTISQQQFDSLNAVPSNGTVLNASGGGGVFIVAGGAPLYVSSYSAVPSAQNDGVAIDDWDIQNAGTNGASHLNAVPSNGTVLDASGGGVFIVAGGAPLYLSSFSAVPTAEGDGVAVDQWDIDNAGTNGASHLNAVPSNGTVLDASGGGVFIVAGGAPLYLSSYSAVPSAQNAGVAIDDWDIENAGTNGASHLNSVPSNGTFLNTSTGHVYRVAGGAPFAVSTWSIFGGEQPCVTIDEWDIDNIANPAAHMNAVPENGTIVEGLPSDTYWSFTGGQRSPSSANPSATTVDDVGLVAFPEKPAASTPGASTTSTSTAGATTVTPASGSTKTGATGASAPRCVVPNVRHMKLAQAKRALSDADCRVGEVHRPRHVSRHHVLRVTSQSAAFGSRHAANYSVNLSLK